jgi:sarcosine oxidase subunit gamma
VTVDVARSALAGRERDLTSIGSREIPFLAQIDVRVDASAPLTLPREANTWLRDGEREVLWLGPDEWLLVGPRGSEDAISNDLERALAGLHHSVVDVSAARAVIELEVVERLELLSNGCGLDLHPRSWRNGMCAQTLLARIPVILQEREASTRIFVRPSFANYLVDWLVHVTRDRT